MPRKKTHTLKRSRTKQRRFTKTKSTQHTIKKKKTRQDISLKKKNQYTPRRVRKFARRIRKGKRLTLKRGGKDWMNMMSGVGQPLKTGLENVSSAFKTSLGKVSSGFKCLTSSARKIKFD